MKQISTLYAQCQYGISGDMFLAALCHLGLELKPLEKLLHEAGVQCSIDTWQENRAAGPGYRVDVQWPEAQPLRHPADIANIWQRMNISEHVREQAMLVLDGLTLAEAHAHSIPPEQVHFHEVGAVDTLVDILGAAWGMEQLGIEKLICSPLPWFSGTVECEHGIIPLPAPATAYLLQNKPTFPTNATSELITPTGAALVHGLCDDFAQGPNGTLLRMGTGYGSRPAPTGLRLWLVKTEQGIKDGYEVKEEYITQLETHIDHLTGEELGSAITSLSTMPEVVDVLCLSGTGKKNRPATLLRVLCLPQHVEAVRMALFTQTHTLGIRVQQISRWILPRTPDTVTLHNHGGNIVNAKAYSLNGDTWLRPEYEALSTLAKEKDCGVPAFRIPKKS